MTKHPQLKAFIDEINSRSKRLFAFTYGDGHKATLSVTPSTVTVTTDNPQLSLTLGKLVERILKGDLRSIDKLEE